MGIAKKKCMKKMGEDDGSDEYAMKLKKCMSRKKSFGHGKDKKPAKKDDVRKQRGKDMEKDGEKDMEKDGEKPEKPSRDARLLQDAMEDDSMMVDGEMKSDEAKDMSKSKGKKKKAKKKKDLKKKMKHKKTKKKAEKDMEKDGEKP